MKEIWELCRELNNPVRMQLLTEIYEPKPTPGLNVGIAIDDSGMKQSTASEHFSALAEKYDKEMRLISRDLKPAAECGLISISAEGSSGIYSYIPPADPIARRIVELSTPIHLSR